MIVCATVITIPRAHSTSFSGASRPSSIRVQLLASPSLGNHHAHNVQRASAPTTASGHYYRGHITALDRIFIQIFPAFQGLHGDPMSPSMTLTLGAEFSLVGVSNQFCLGSGSHNISPRRCYRKAAGTLTTFLTAALLLRLTTSTLPGTPQTKQCMSVYPRSSMGVATSILWPCSPFRSRRQPIRAGLG